MSDLEDSAQIEAAVGEPAARASAWNHTKSEQAGGGGLRIPDPFVPAFAQVNHGAANELLRGPSYLPEHLVRRGEVAGTMAMREVLKEGSCDSPALVFATACHHVADLVHEGVLDAEDGRLAALTVLARYWQGFGVDDVGPARYDRRDWWVGRFRALGWAHLWDRQPRPSPLQGPGVLYRGSPEGMRDGLAWTPHHKMARWFAQRSGGQVWRLRQPESAQFLAAFPIEVKGVGISTEYLIDVADIDAIGAAR